MIVVSAKDLTKTYGTDVILEKVSFHINKGERIGIIGVNGAGKTTLLRMLTGELPCDEGEFFISADMRIGYLKQDGGFDPDGTVMGEVEKIFARFPRMEEEMESLLRAIEGEASDALLEKYDALQEEYRRQGGYSYRSEITGILSSMAFGEDSYDKKISSLSGGERTRLALACLLLSKPDILFLDEPTNHLDIGTLRWLEQYLKGYDGTIVLVSHDRYFLNQTVNRIFEIENHRLRIYEGNYTFYATERRSRREAELRQYEKQQREIHRQEEMIRRFKQHGTEKLAKRAASREKRLAAVDRLERPDAERGGLKLDFRENFRSGRDVLLLEGLGKQFGGENGRRLFSGVDMDVKRGERVCIVGANGIGKTTLLRMILGEISCTEGRIRTGYNVQFGYYDQGQMLLNGSNTVIDELHDAYRLYTEPELRNVLGRFLFRGEDVFLRVDSLSGGEKARLALLKLMLSGANVLILDEPTNHLDIESKEVFEEALLDFPGTCIIVSHDRYFLSRIPTRIIELTADGAVNYLGTYDYYVEKKQSQVESGKKYMDQLSAQQAGPQRVELAKSDTLSAAEQRRIKKEQETRERRLRRRRERLETEIGELEDEILQAEAELTLEENMTDRRKLTELAETLEKKRSALDEKYEEWLNLQD